MTRASSRSPRVACVGAFILDVLGRPVDRLPTSQESVLVEEIRLTAAGPAGGTAVDLARLGIDVLAIGAIGTDAAGEMLTLLLNREGVDTAGLTSRVNTPTSVSILPINSAGVRPAFHLTGAAATLSASDIPGSLDGIDALHYGGAAALPALDGEGSFQVLADARARGILVTADCLGVRRADALAPFAESLVHVDVFMPNRAEAAMLTGHDDTVDAGRALLSEHGPRAVIVKDGDKGCVVVTADLVEVIPARPGPVIDTTGCGDAFCAGTIRALLMGWDLVDAAHLGIVAGGLTAAGLGSDAGLRDLESTLAELARFRQAAFTDGGGDSRPHIAKCPARRRDSNRNKR